jgi:hypothetical protein
MEPKIEKLTEAFSMQPETYMVCPIKYNGNVKHIHSWHCIKEIKEVQLGQYEWIYCGFNFNDQKIFEIQGKSVNVFYTEDNGTI